MKIQNCMKYFKEGVSKYFKISIGSTKFPIGSTIFLNISKWNISSCIPSCKAKDLGFKAKAKNFGLKAKVRAKGRPTDAEA